MDEKMKEMLAEVFDFADIAFSECEQEYRVLWVLEFYSRLTDTQKEEFKKKIL